MKLKTPKKYAYAYHILEPSSSHVSPRRQVHKAEPYMYIIPPAPGTNQMAGFVEFRPLTSRKRINNRYNSSHKNSRVLLKYVYIYILCVFFFCLELSTRYEFTQESSSSAKQEVDQLKEELKVLSAQLLRQHNASLDSQVRL